MKRQPVRATGRLLVSGSTRYTSKGSKKKLARTKTLASVTAGSIVGSVVPGPGTAIGEIAGRRFATSRGYTRRTKQRMTLRATNAQFGHADKAFHKSRKYHGAKVAA